MNPTVHITRPMRLWPESLIASKARRWGGDNPGRAQSRNRVAVDRAGRTARA